MLIGKMVVNLDLISVRSSRCIYGRLNTLAPLLRVCVGVGFAAWDMLVAFKNLTLIYCLYHNVRT